MTENVYCDGKRMYNVERLWSLVKRRKPRRIKTDKLDYVLDSRVWYTTPKNIIKKKVGQHWNRIIDAELKYPLLVDEEYYIIDGCHRWCKAHLNGQKTIRVHVIKKKDLKRVRMKGNI